MAFEQNQAINRLIGGAPSYQMPNFMNGQQAPSIRSQPLNQPQGWLNNFKEFLFGSQPQQYSYSPYTGNQQNALQQLLMSGMQNQQNPYGDFDLLQQQIMDQYHNQIIPQLSEQFTSGTGGAASSPQFTRSLAGANQGLASQLLQHKLNYGQQNRQFGLQQAQLGLTPQYENFQTPPTTGLLGGLLGSIPQLANTGIKYGLMGRL